jgi:hypothetical protein
MDVFDEDADDAVITESSLLLLSFCIKRCTKYILLLSKFLLNKFYFKKINKKNKLSCLLFLLFENNKKKLVNHYKLETYKNILKKYRYKEKKEKERENN